MQARALHSREAEEEKQGHILLGSQFPLLLSRSCCHSRQTRLLEQFHVCPEVVRQLHMLIIVPVGIFSAVRGQSPL